MQTRVASRSNIFSSSLLRVRARGPIGDFSLGSICLHPPDRAGNDSPGDAHDVALLWHPIAVPGTALGKVSNIDVSPNVYESSSERLEVYDTQYIELYLSVRSEVSLTLQEGERSISKPRGPP